MSLQNKDINPFIKDWERMKRQIESTHSAGDLQCMRTLVMSLIQAIDKQEGKRS